MSTANTDVDVSSLAAQMTGKTKAEQLNMIRSFTKENYQTELEEKAPEIVLSPEQFDRMFSGVTSEVKKVAAEAASTVENRYGLSSSEARSLAEDEVSKQIRRKQHFRQDCEVAADVFRAMARTATNSSQFGELESARDRELKYLKDTGREVRAITAGTGSAGGYMAPETWNTLVYENLQRVSMLRRYAKWMPMPENTGGIMRLPKLTGNVTGQSVSELAATQTSQVTLAQATWSLKKLAVLSNPISIELLYEATPNIVDMLVSWATIELNRKEDEVTFNTTDTQWSSSYLLGSNTNVVTMGTGKTNLTDVTFDDLAAMIFQLSEQYVPDGDVQGSNQVTGEAAFFLNKAVLQQLLKLKGTDNGYLLGSVMQELSGKRSIYGYQTHRTISMPSTATTGTKFAAFGNLGYVWVAYRPGFFIDFLNQGTVASTNLNENFGYSVRVGEMLDIQRIDDNAFSLLKTA